MKRTPLKLSDDDRRLLLRAGEQLLGRPDAVQGLVGSYGSFVAEEIGAPTTAQKVAEADAALGKIEAAMRAMREAVETTFTATMGTPPDVRAAKQAILEESRATLDKAGIAVANVWQKIGAAERNRPRGIKIVVDRRGTAEFRIARACREALIAAGRRASFTPTGSIVKLAQIVIELAGYNPPAMARVVDQLRQILKRERAPT